MIRNAGDRGCKYLVFCAIISLKKYGSFFTKVFIRGWQQFTGCTAKERVTDMSMIADIIVLALVIAYGVFVISYLYSRKKQGLSCVGCAGNTHTGGCGGSCSVECISNQEEKKSWQMQLLSSLLSSLCCLPEKAHINI